MLLRGERTVITVGGGNSSEPEPEGHEDDGLKPLSERLITELTAHRTLAFRDALANDPNTAFVAVLHTLCLGAFYRVSSTTCLEISAKSASFNAQRRLILTHFALGRRLNPDPHSLLGGLSR